MTSAHTYGSEVDEPLDHLVAFIAYAHGDGEEAVRQLRDRLPPWVEPWVDDARWPGEAVTVAITKAMSGSDLVLYVMTPRSVQEDHWCQREIRRAEVIGLPVIGLQFHPDADAPIQMDVIPPINVAGARAEEGWPELSRQLLQLASPLGRMYRLNKQLGMLRNRASLAPEARERFEAHIKEKEAQVEALERRANDPGGAVRRQQHEIREGQDLDRAPERIALQQSPVLCVGEPPAVPPNQFRDRIGEVEDLERYLNDSQVRLVTVIGRDGIGKTAMIYKLWDRIRTRESPLRVHGLVYLSAHAFGPVNADSLIKALLRMVPGRETAQDLEEQLELPMPWVEKLVAVLNALEDLFVIIAVDAVEELLDRDAELADPALRELVDHLVLVPGHNVRLLLVGRGPAQSLLDRFPAATHRRNLEEGLPEGEAYALLCAMDADGGLGLENASEHDIGWLHNKTSGSPRALELAYGILVDGPDRSLTWLLDLMQQYDREHMATHLFAWAFERLDRDERLAIQALAIYGRPVLASTVDYLLQDHATGLQSEPVLERLHRRRLVRRDGDHYYVPPTPESDYVLGTIRRGSTADLKAVPPPYTQIALLHRAAGYFATVRVPGPKHVGDLRAELSEVELRVRAGEHRAAFDLMAKVDDDYLMGWGYSGSLVPSLLQLLDEPRDLGRTLEIDTMSLLARVLMQQEEYARATDYAQTALDRASGSLRAESRIELRLQLAAANRELENVQDATMHSRRAYWAAIRHGWPSPIAGALAEQAVSAAVAGRFTLALQRCAVAQAILRIRTAPSNSTLRPTLFINAAWIHGQLGHRDHAWDCLRKGRRWAGEPGHGQLQGKCRLGEAELLIDEGRLGEAIGLAKEAADIGIQGGNRALCRDAKEIEALACLCAGDLPAAAAATEIATRHRCSVGGFGLAGLVAYRRGMMEVARAAFQQGHDEAVRLRRPGETNFQLLDNHGVVACGLALVGDRQGLPTAVEAYQAARQRTTADGAVRRNLLLLEQFGGEADSVILDRVRAAARGAQVQ